MKYRYFVAAGLLLTSFIALQLHLDSLHRDRRHTTVLRAPRDEGPHCLPVECIHGVLQKCNRTGMPDTCSCHHNSTLGYWMGKKCHVCLTDYYGTNCTKYCNRNTTCSKHGTCSINGTCMCDQRYEGLECQKYIYPADTAKLEAIKAEMAHSWKAYEKYAFGHDELMPVSKDFKDWANEGIGLTLIDAIDTLYIMGLQREYLDARRWIDTKFDIRKDGAISVFECTIRIVGGLMGIYALTNDPLYVKKATKVYEALEPAFQTTSGIPWAIMNPVTGEMGNQGWARGMNVLSEFGSLQLEYNYLALESGKPNIRRHTDNIMELLRKAEEREAEQGLFPVYFQPDLGHFTQSMSTMGGMSDSYYEYLLKQWIQSGHKHPFAKDMYTRAMEGMKKLLVQKNDKYTFLVQRLGDATRYRMDHLSCFVPGMLILGLMHNVTTVAVTVNETFKLAKDLLATCIHMYEFTATGLSPEDVSFDDAEMMTGIKHNMLRPEVVESIFYMWRYTHDEYYRKIGWKIFQSFVKYCRVSAGGYSGYRNVLIAHWEDAMKLDTEEDSSPYTNVMESFWLAETLKYFYLLFSEDKVIDLQKYVFNTEAHPFPIWWN
eukprot:PhF_6_TR10823/c0_g1_i1/m.17462/K01230/MAN1; mannosyl-oligosaccharide alpha-1,2-mannosidase